MSWLLDLREIFYQQRVKIRSELSQTATQLISKAPVIGEGREQWIVNMDFVCVHDGKKFPSRDALMKHYDDTRHDKYSAWI